MKILILILVSLAMLTPAIAFWHGKAPVGSCSLSLNFSQACNSQYLVLGPLL